MIDAARVISAPSPRSGAIRELTLAAILASLLGLAFLLSMPLVLVACTLAGGTVLLAVLAQRLSIDPATAFFLFFVLLMVAFGRDFSYLHLELGGLPLYVTELALIVLVVVAFRRWLRHRLATNGLGNAASLLLAAYIVLGLARLPFSLSAHGLEAVRDAVICTYAIFAFLTAWLLTTRQHIRLLGSVVVLGSLAASVWIGLNALKGEGVMTSTPGLLRYGAGIQAFSATFTALIWVALWSTGQLNRRGAMIGGALVATQSILSLLLVQHRSQLLALIVGLTVLTAAHPRRHRLGALGLTAAIIVTLLLALNSVGILPGVTHPLWKATIERAATSLDPEADTSTEWRIQVNRQVLTELLDTPLTGAGFGPAIAFRYTSVDSENVDPHNSFVAILYRLGVPTALLLFIALGLLIRRALRSRYASDGEHLAMLLSALAGLVGMGVFACFNVVLEGPYLGVFFWIPVGVLMRLTADSWEAPSRTIQSPK